MTAPLTGRGTGHGPSAKPAVLMALPAPQLFNTRAPAGPGLAPPGAICHDLREMCGRFSLTMPADAMARLFGVEDVPDLAPRHNIAPSQAVAVVRRADDGGRREIVHMRWGFVPAWARDPDSMHRPINARAETVAGKPMFRDAFRNRRCLIPADGFYEWRPAAGGKQPWRIVRADGAPFAFAGLWDRWKGRDGQVIESCVIITTDANATIRPIHERMPVMLDIGRFETWLSGPAIAAAELMEPYRGALAAFPVSRRVNDPSNDDPELIEPTGPAAAAPEEAEEPPKPDREPRLI